MKLDHVFQHSVCCFWALKMTATASSNFRQPQPHPAVAAGTGVAVVLCWCYELVLLRPVYPLTWCGWATKGFPWLCLGSLSATIGYTDSFNRHQTSAGSVICLPCVACARWFCGFVSVRSLCWCPSEVDSGAMVLCRTLFCGPMF